MSYNSEAKITEQEIIVRSNEHICWFDITMNAPVAMHKL